MARWSDRRKLKLKQLNVYSAPTGQTITCNFHEWSNTQVENEAVAIAQEKFKLELNKPLSAWSLIDGKVYSKAQQRWIPIEIKGEIFKDSSRQTKNKWVHISNAQLQFLKRHQGLVWLVRFYKTDDYYQNQCRWSLLSLSPVDMSD